MAHLPKVSHKCVHKAVGWLEDYYALLEVWCVLPMRFRLAELLLAFWARLEASEWMHNETVILVRCDLARQEKGIPSVLA